MGIDEKLTKATRVSMHFMKKKQRGYSEITGHVLLPWVGSLGSRTGEGAVGMSVLVGEVSKWVETTTED